MKNLLFLLLLALFVGGCNIFGHTAYVLFGRTGKDVEAEYEGLAGEKVAIIIAVADEVDYNYPGARMNIALAVAKAIGQNVKDVEFVAQEKVQAFQQSQPDWIGMPMSEIAGRFGAGRVLYLDVYQFDMYERHSKYLLRGQISATVRVYERKGSNTDQAVYRGEAETLFPKHQPITAGDTAMLKVQTNTIDSFAEQMARKFYDHEVKIR